MLLDKKSKVISFMLIACFVFMLQDSIIYAQDSNKTTKNASKSFIINDINSLDTLQVEWLLSDAEYEILKNILSENVIKKQITVTLFSEKRFENRRYRYVEVQIDCEQAYYNILQPDSNIIDYLIYRLRNVGLLSETDITCNAQKKENVTIQFIDYLEGKTYISRAKNTFGHVLITTETTNWVANNLGGYINKPILETNLDEPFGEQKDIITLLKSSEKYYKFFLKNMQYKNCVTSFPLGKYQTVKSIISM